MGTERWRVPGFFLLAALVMAGPAPAAQRAVTPVFTAQERQAIQAYYRTEMVKQAWADAGQRHGTPKGLPPGLARKPRLAPPIERQIARGRRLPDGLEKDLEPLPAVLESRLKPLPQPYARIVIGTNVIIVNARTQQITDVLRDVAVLTRTR
jgi:hypothetical protein